MGDALTQREGGAFVAASAQIDAGVSLGPGAVVYDGAVIGAGTRVDTGAIIHAGTIIGAGCLVESGVVLGKRPRLRPGSAAAGSVDDLVIEDDVTVCANAVVYAGALVKRGAIVGDQSQVRERSILGEGSVLGRGSTLDFNTRVGARVSIQSLVYLTSEGLVEDDVFIGPGVVTTNDHTMSRHSNSDPLRGPVLRRACRVGAGAVLTPGVEIGEEAFIAAGTVVARDVGVREVVLGVPGRAIRRVGDEDLLERWQ
jgi:UDP-3-O-[3-hydroxymyristoyl] glucosamine N-acyltransferase